MPTPIVTTFVFPPLGCRSSDWCAMRADADPENNPPVGWGKTESDAINDLIEQESEE